MHPPVRLLALDWSSDLPPATVHRICGDRIVARGDNHQSLHADAAGKSHEEVVWMFLRDKEELLDNEVDESVEMDVEESLENALARAVDACVRILDVPRPTTEQMGQALAIARGYSPTKKRQTKEPQKGEGGRRAKTKKPPRYYALLPEVDIERVLDKRTKEDDVPEKGREFFLHLKGHKRVTDRPHVTIVHEKGLPGDSELWERCKHLFAMSTPPVFSFKLGNLVWDDRVMAITVSDLAVSTDHNDPDAKGAEFMANLLEEFKEKMHVTVGTRSKDVPPVEARDLVARWKKGERGIGSCKLDELWVKGRIKGLMG